MRTGGRRNVVGVFDIVHITPGYGYVPASAWLTT
jgi:hypothetical protein